MVSASEVLQTCIMTCLIIMNHAHLGVHVSHDICPTIFHDVFRKTPPVTLYLFWGEVLIGSTKLLLCAAKSSMVITPPGNHGMQRLLTVVTIHVSPVQLII